MKKAIFLGTILLVLGGFYSACSAYTLTIQRGDITIGGTTYSAQQLISYGVRIYVHVAVDGVAKTTGMNNFQDITSTPFFCPVGANENVVIQAKSSYPIGVGGSAGTGYTTTIPKNLGFLTSNKIVTITYKSSTARDGTVKIY